VCGIVGALSWGDFRISENYINRMRNTLQHRGPDSQNTWINQQNNIGLGHQRLAIVDLDTAANQPMLSRDQRYAIVFNGEIYNHQHLRDKLKKRGVQDWQTHHSDTEVVLQAFVYWGIQCMHEFRGMFAFAIWDNHARRLWLVRDRIGIKPLYYSFHHQRCVFASEIKALLQDEQQPRVVNSNALFHYLSFLATPAPSTLFQGIYKLPASSYLIIEANGQYQLNYYWDVWDYTQPLINASEKEIAEKVLTELRTTVQMHKMSDVPMGVFLSGGIDSSVNAALFSENETRIKTFSIGYDREYKSYRNELHYAKMMAATVNAEHHELRISIDDILNFLPEMVALQDEPIADPVCVPLYYLSKLAHDTGIKVCQVGEGADELFIGYPSWKIKHMLTRYNQIPGLSWAKKLLFTIISQSPGLALPAEFLQRGIQQQPIFWGGNDAFTQQQKQDILSDNLKCELSDLSSWDVISPIWQRFHNKAWDKSILNWMSYLDLNYRLPELLLMRTDKMAMGVSLECRVPFLDHELVTLAMSIPAKLKMKNGVLKNILKQSVTGLIPQAIIDRPKQGFGLPVYELLFGKLGNYTKKVLTEFCQRTDYFNPQQVNQLLQQPSGPHTWYLLNFALWHAAYIEIK